MLTRTPAASRDRKAAVLSPPPAIAMPADKPWVAGASTPLIPTVFHAPWWLEAVSGGCWKEIEVRSGRKVIGRLPYLPSRRFGQDFIGMPELTHFLGPAVDHGDGSASTRLLRRIGITRDLIAGMPPCPNVWIKFHRGVSDTLAFQHSGFRSEVQFTMEVAPATETVLWEGLRDTARRVIRRAAETLRVIELDDPATFIAFYDANVAARALRNVYSKPACLRTLLACQQNNAGRVLAAVNEKGGLDAAVFTVWDDVSAYYLMTTRRPDADNGAISLLVWVSMLHAAAHRRVFDLDGVSTSGDVQFLTRFGGTVQPRYVVQRTSLAGRLVTRWENGRQSFLERKDARTVVPLPASFGLSASGAGSGG